MQTLTKSIDDSSGLQTSGVFGSALILNPLRQRDNRAVSDFDVRHIVNFNSVWELPVGRGKALFGGSNKIIDAFIGGWQLSNIFRFNSGRPISAPFDANGWATNWNVRSVGVRLRNLQSSPSANGNRNTTTGNSVPNLFSDPVAAYKSFRSPRPGETGDRNILRYPGFITMALMIFALTKGISGAWLTSSRV